MPSSSGAPGSTISARRTAGIVSAAAARIAWSVDDTTTRSRRAVDRRRYGVDECPRARSGRFEIQDEDPSVGGPHDLAQRRDPVPPVQHYAVELGVGRALDQPGHPGHAVQIGVVHADGDAVPGQADIHLDAVGTHAQCLARRLDGVLRRPQVCHDTSVSDHQHGPDGAVVNLTTRHRRSERRGNCSRRLGRSQAAGRPRTGRRPRSRPHRPTYVLRAANAPGRLGENVPGPDPPEAGRARCEQAGQPVACRTSQVTLSPCCWVQNTRQPCANGCGSLAPEDAADARVAVGDVDAGDLVVPVVVAGRGQRVVRRRRVAALGQPAHGGALRVTCSPRRSIT